MNNITYIVAPHHEISGLHTVVIASVNAVTRARLILTVGVLETVEKAKVWAEDCIQRKAWEDASELPDIYG